MGCVGTWVKREWFVLVLCVCIGHGIRAQKIQYGKDLLFARYLRNTQLVANVQGYHHIVVFDAGKPIIYVFDKSLRLTRKAEIDYLFDRNATVKILSVGAFYYLYIHPDKSFRHDLWRVNGEGVVTPLTKQFQRLVDTAIGRKNTMLSLSNEGGILSAMAHTYFESEKSVETVVARFDNDLKLLSANKVEWTFDLHAEVLQQILLQGNALFVLKRAIGGANTESILITKINITNGSFTTTSFGNFSKKFFFVRMSRANVDSSLLLYGVIDETPDGIWMTRKFFFAEADSGLRQQAPPQLMKPSFLKTAGTAFVFAAGRQQTWLSMHNDQRPFTEFISTDTTPKNATYFTFRDNLPFKYNQLDFEETGFAVLDSNLKLKGDSLTKAKYSVALQPFPSAQVKLKNKSYLAMTQLFHNKRRSLVLIGTDTKLNFKVINVPVYEHYEYDLSNLQTVDGEYFIVPYKDKDQMGLMKVTMDNE